MEIRKLCWGLRLSIEALRMFSALTEIGQVSRSRFPEISKGPSGCVGWSFAFCYILLFQLKGMYTCPSESLFFCAAKQVSQLISYWRLCFAHSSQASGIKKLLRKFETFFWMMACQPPMISIKSSVLLIYEKSILIHLLTTGAKCGCGLGATPSLFTH